MDTKQLLNFQVPKAKHPEISMSRFQDEIQKTAALSMNLVSQYRKHSPS